MPALKTAFEKYREIKPLHTGGPVTVDANGQKIFTCVGDEVVLTDLEKGQEICRFIADDETINSFCLTPDASYFAVFTASLTLHIYSDPLNVPSSDKPVRTSRTVARSHEAPVHVCAVDPTSTFLASGSADGVVKIWDLHRGYVTHAFKGHGGVISTLAFRFIHDTSSAINVQPTLQLITGCVDTKLRVFDLNSKSGGGKPLAVLEGHVSVPRSIDVTPDGKRMISAGRDSVVLIWEFAEDSARSSKGKGKEVAKLVKTIPVLERVEAAGLLPNDLTLGAGGISSEKSTYFFTAGEKGTIKIWDASKGASVTSLNELQSDSEEEMEVQREILDARYLSSQSSIFSIHADHNILFHSLSSRSLTRQLIGFNDEIIDACFLNGTAPDSHLAVAANSSLIRVYSTTENDARLLSGHSGMLLCLSQSVDGKLLASGSKDKSVRLWSFDNDRQMWSCVASCDGHAESVGAVALSRKQDENERARFLFSGSQDRTIKMWDLASLPVHSDDSELHKCKSLSTQKAHEKDINSLDVSPNDLFLASGSQDKTAKVYEISYVRSGTNTRGELKLLGTCKGHKRGVWTVKFGRFDKVLATGSGDKTVKLWNLDDFSCVKTFEGHTNSVLRVDFLNHDMQLATTASDGLLKLWNVRTEECQATMDNHEDKVWALATNSQESVIVTGAADSTITFWKDCTVEKQKQQEAEREEAILKDQDFANYVALKDYRSAISLALSMDQPGRLFALFKELLSMGDSPGSDSEGNSHVTSSVIRNLPPAELAKLMRHIRTWNANARTSMVAQAILHAIFKLRTTDDVSEALGQTSGSTATTSSREANSVSEIVQALTPYTERHLARLDRLVQDSYVLDFILAEMDGGMLVGGDEAMVMA
ncbi:WD40 repeat-like protein [Schizopora paradoxa]|uniref:WD40 repeat-like protein n=1 Tax=Schizopora paradoxa TaxID=27342 RepID=A0A0H2SEC1_9AGAM|nr:WD40 repeat-like protein [Schizopora paradoxa]